MESICRRDDQQRLIEDEKPVALYIQILCHLIRIKRKPWVSLPASFAAPRQFHGYPYPAYPRNVASETNLKPISAKTKRMPLIPPSFSLCSSRFPHPSYFNILPEYIRTERPAGIPDTRKHRINIPKRQHRLLLQTVHTFSTRFIYTTKWRIIFKIIGIYAIFPNKKIKLRHNSFH